MANFYTDNADLRFYFEGGMDWDDVVRLTERDFKAEGGFTDTSDAMEFYRDVLEMIGGFVAEEVAPNARLFEKEKPRLVDGEVVYGEAWDALFESINGLGIHGLTMPRELGGMNAPLLVLQFMNELFARGDVSVAAHNGFHGGMALAALMYSTIEGTTEFQQDPPSIKETRFAEAIAQMISGQAFGSMDITEPDAGSDMAALRTKGEVDADGNWFVTGQKIFITSGHGKWHFVIARTEQSDEADAFAGLQGLSMFLVQAYEEDAAGNRTRPHTNLDALEDKLGHTGSATVAINFDHAPAHLIGKRGEGFRYMLLLMNGARVGVGFECIGLCESALRLTKDYAAERRSMGKTIDKHEMIADYLDEMGTDIQGLRAITAHACRHEELSQKARIELDHFPPSDPEAVKRLKKFQRKHARRARHLTPLLKYFGAEKAVEMSRRGIQIHGGSGYIKEYDAEKLLRDAIVMPIYEGTSQIQALMAMKDRLMGVVKQPKRFVTRGTTLGWRSVSLRDPLARRLAGLQLMEHGATRFLLTKLTVNKLGELPSHPMSEWGSVFAGWDPKKDFALAMLHAERLCIMLVDVAVAEELFEQSKTHPERREVLERWLERAEPRSRYQRDLITTTGLRLLSSLAE